MHALTRLGVPATTVRTRWMFGFQRRLVRRWECEMLCPKLGPLPQTSQLAATFLLLIVVPPPPVGRGEVGDRHVTSGDRTACQGARNSPGNLDRVADQMPRAQLPDEEDMVQDAADTAAGVRQWLTIAVGLLDEHREILDATNVFPVPDSDTGTNLFLTMGEAAQAVGDVPVTAAPAVVARAAVRGSLVGARGNSGVIVTQYLGALLASDPSGALPGIEDAAASVAALDRAAVSARRAVARPVEGTVLTVARAVADGAARALAGGAGDSRGAVLRAGIEAGWRALAETPDQLPVLRQAGVVDAGAWGLLLVLEALAEVLTGTVGRHALDRTSVTAWPVPLARPVEGGAFEVMFVVDDPAEDVAPALREALAAIGDSVAVVGAEGLRQAHVHTDHPLAALAAARDLGVEPIQVRVRHLIGGHPGDQVPERPADPHTPAPTDLGLVAVTGAPGLVADLARAGAVVVLVGPGRAAGPELARALADTAAHHVLLLAPAGLIDPLAARRGPVVGARPLGEVVALDGLAEVQVAAAGAAWCTLDHTGPAAGRIARMRATVEAVAVARPTPRALPDAARSALGAGAGLLTVVSGPDAGLDEAALRTALAADLAAAGAELVVLPGVLAGAAVELGAE